MGSDGGRGIESEVRCAGNEIERVRERNGENTELGEERSGGYVIMNRHESIRDPENYKYEHTPSVPSLCVVNTSFL